jgi:FkbM family methyltransferase
MNFRKKLARIKLLRQFYYSVDRWFKYFHVFGLIEGIRIYILLRRRRNDTICIHVKKTSQPIMVRRNTSDVHAFEHIFVYRTYEIDIPHGEGGIIDGGSNAGYAAVYFANRFPEKKILAIEPDESNAEMIRKNASNYSNVEIIQAAIWPVNTTLRIMNPKATHWAFQVGESTDTTLKAIRTVTIDELLTRYKLNKISLLKLDVEGSEKEIFSEHYESWISKVECLAIEFHDYFKEGCRNAVMNALRGKIKRHKQMGENDIFYLNN